MRRFYPLIPILCLSLSGCNELERAIKLGECSKATYDAVADSVVAEIARLVKASETAPLTDEEKATLKALNGFRPTLDGFAKVHNAYVQALRIWQTTGEQPVSITSIGAELEQFIVQAAEIQKLLK